MRILETLKFARAAIIELAVTVGTMALAGYLSAETLNAFTGAPRALPLSSALVVSAGLPPDAVGAILGAILLGLIGVFVFYVWTYTPQILSSYFGTAPAKKALAPPPPRALRVEDLKLAEKGDSQQFVDVFPLEGYGLNVYAAITKEEGREGYKYVVIEPTLTDAEKVSMERIKKLLVDELDVDIGMIQNRAGAENYLASKVRDLSKKYGYKVPQGSMAKLQYYLSRDFIRLGKIEPLMRDKLIEDISCDGANIPIYVWYRDYESVPTNIMFESEEELDTFVSKLAYSAGKHVSLAEPIVDASLEDGSRLHLTYGKEVTQKGSTFTIRKFRADPLTIVDLIKYNTMSSDVAAYLWYIIEKKLALLVAGGTASGKSVPYDEKVLVYRHGRPALLRIGDLYDELAVGGRATREGMYDTVECEELGTPAFDSDLRIGIFKVKSIVRHPAPKKIFVVRTLSGRVVRATGDHSVFTLAEGSVVPTPTSKLSPGSFVAIPRSIPDAPGVPGCVDLLELLGASERPIYVENVAEFIRQSVERLGDAEVSRILRIRRRSIREGIRRGFLTVPVGRFLSLAAAAKIAIRPESLWVRSKTHGGFKIRAQLPISKSLARFLGYWTAEGMYQEKGVTLFQLDPQTRKDMLDCAFQAFGIIGKPSKGSDPTRIDFNSSVLESVLRALFGRGAGSSNKRIPGIMLAEGNETLAQYLRGYFTGDASVGNVIEATTKSKELGPQLQYALLRFNIVARLSPKIVGGNKYHRVTIYGQTNLRTFEERIGFQDEARRARLRDAVSADIKPHTNLDTIPGIAPLLKEALIFKHGQERKELWSNWHSYLSPNAKKAIGRNTLLTFMSKTGAKDMVEEKLSRLAYSDIFWDEVLDVEETDFEGEYVYDLEVPGAENFVGGSGGVFLHNTTSLNALSMFIEPGQKIVSVEDSVTRDAEILVSEGGNVRKVKIGDYVDARLPSTPETSPSGHEIARPNGLQVLTSDAAGKTFWAPCSALIRHQVCKEFVRITTSSGKVLEVTSDHSLFSVGADGDISEIAAGSLSAGAYIAAPRSLPGSGQAYRFNLERLGAFSEFDFKPVRSSNGLVTLQQMRVHAKHSPLSIPAEIVLDEDLAFLAGLWIADGFYGDRTVGFSAIEKGVEGRLKMIAADLGLNVTRDSDGVSLLLNSKPLRTFFESTLGLTGDDYSRHVPDIIVGAEDALVASFLRGYFTGDGSVVSSEISVSCASRQLLIDVQTLLLRFGVQLKIGTKRQIGRYGGQGTLKAMISGTAQVAVFKQKIGFEQEEKMAKIVVRPNRSKYHVDPIPLNETLVNEIRPSLEGITQTALGQRLRKGIRRKVISRQTILDLGLKKPEYGRSKGFALAESGFFFDSVKTVEKSVREERVYDLSVPDTNRFIANNIICHNTAELNLPHENWIQSVTRGVGTPGEITMFDLLKASLRQRPDVIIVGEVRGEEAFTLLQSIATGHGGLGTIHADSVEAVINRLTTEPMNIPRSLLGSTLDCVAMQLKMRMVDKSVRRVVHVAEVVGHDPRTDQIILNDAFRWDPVSDKFVFSGRSRLFDKITQRYGTKSEEIKRDVEGRKTFLDWMAARNIRSYDEVSEQVREFYGGPYAVINKAKVELEERAA